MDVTVLREIAEGARVHPDARVGPFCTVGPGAVIGPRTLLASHVTVIGQTSLGSDNVVGHGCVLGAGPQDLKFRGGKTYLRIGDRNRLGPNVTAHVGTERGGYLTRIGDDNVLEAGAHVAHDCFVDDRTHLGAGVLLAGHIRVCEGATLEEMAGVHHFTTVGRFSRVGARTPVRRDVPPFTFFTSSGYYNFPSAVRGVHEPGMAAAGLGQQQMDELRQAVAHLFRDEHALAVKVRAMLAQPDLIEPVRELCEFCQKSLSGHFGRFRERFRGEIPPEARMHLPPDAFGEASPNQGDSSQ